MIDVGHALGYESTQLVSEASSVEDIRAYITKYINLSKKLGGKLTLKENAPDSVKKATTTFKNLKDMTFEDETKEDESPDENFGKSDYDNSFCYISKVILYR